MDYYTEELFGLRDEIQSHHDSISEAGDSEPEEIEDIPEAEEVPANEDNAVPKKPPKPKRVIKNPQPKLDVTRLLGPRGLGMLNKHFRDIKFKGQGHEKEDLDELMKKLVHWAHRLFPKLPFAETLNQIEKLGEKKPIQVHLKRLRLDMTEDIVPESSNEQEDKENLEPQIDVFDEILGRAHFQRADDILPQIPQQTLSITRTQMTDELRERLERNRRAAEERRDLRLQQEREKQASQQPPGSPLLDASQMYATNTTDEEEDMVHTRDTDEMVELSTQNNALQSDRTPENFKASLNQVDTDDIEDGAMQMNSDSDSALGNVRLDEEAPVGVLLDSVVSRAESSIVSSDVPGREELLSESDMLMMIEED